MLIVPEIKTETERRWAPFFANVRATHTLGRELVAEGHAHASAGGVSERLALFFLARATVTLNAVELLFSAGLALDATATLRTLVELAIDLEFIWKEDTAKRIELYTEYIHVLGHRRLEAQERIFGAVAPRGSGARVR